MKEKSMKEALETLKSGEEIIIDGVGKVALKETLLEGVRKGRSSAAWWDISISLKEKTTEGDDYYAKPLKVGLLNSWLVTAIYNLDDKSAEEIFAGGVLQKDFEEAMDDWKERTPEEERTMPSYIEKEAEVFDDLIKQYLLKKKVIKKVTVLF